MFEHSIYDQDPIAEPVPTAHEGDLFHNYEIRSWVLSPRLYKILAISAVGNLLALLIVAQTSLLTMKGCDSPLVGSVCQVLDTVYVGALLLGNKREYVDASYERTNLGDMDITYIELPPENSKLEYPEGYFQIANPERFSDVSDTTSDTSFPTYIPTYPGIPTTRPTPGNNLLNTPPVYSRRKTNINEDELPTGFGNNPTLGNNKPGSNKQRPGDGIAGIPGSTNTNTNSQNPTDPNRQVTPTDSIPDVDINRRPMVDLANNVNDLLDKKQINLESPFVVSAKGKLGKDGKFDPKTFTWGPITSQDEKMKEVVKSTVEAINDAGFLGYLKQLSGKDFSMMLQQDDQNISGIVQSEMESNNRANSIRTALGIVLDMAKQRKTAANANENDKDDLILLQGATVEADGKKVVIKFVVPKNVALPMIQRKLAEQKAAVKTPNSNAVIRENNGNAVR